MMICNHAMISLHDDATSWQLAGAYNDNAFSHDVQPCYLLILHTMRLGWCYFYLKLGLSPRLSSQSIILLKADLWLLLSTYNFGNDTNTRPELILCSGILDKCLLVQIQISWLSERVTLWVAWPQSWIYIYTNLHKFVKLTILMRILNQGNVFKH